VNDAARTDGSQPGQPDPSIAVRPAQPADARAIAAIHVRAWREGYRDILPAELLRRMSIARRELHWRQALRERAAETLVAESGRRMLGWIAVGKSRDADAAPSSGELWAINVDPPAWGRGAGRALWRAGEEHLRWTGFRDVTLWVLADNARARRFYAALGFDVDGDRQKLFEQGGAKVVEIRMRRALRT